MKLALVFLVALVSLAPWGGLALLPTGSVAATALDEFGIRQLYPNATEGLAWDSQHWNNGNPRSFTSANWDPDDPSGWSRHAGSQCISIDGKGVMIFNKDCGGGVHPRLYLDAVTRDDKKFTNVEITGYHRRVEDADLSYGGFSFGMRSGPSGHDPSGDHCLATTYYARLGNDGNAAFVKELVHAASGGVSEKPIWGGDPRAYNQWVGMKFVVYNLDGENVKLEMYIDETEGANGGTWILINEFVDDGTWSGGEDDELSECMDRGLFPDGQFHIIREGNGVVFIRDTDVDQGLYKWFTVREIVGTFENQAPTANAGPNQSIIDAEGDGVETVTLDGSGSDPDGTIASYHWTEGATVLGSTAGITTDFTVGTHTVTLTVTDDNGATGSDTVVISVEGTWSSGDLEPDVWSESGKPRSRYARKDYDFQPPSSITGIDGVTVTVNVISYNALGSGSSDGIPPSLEVWTKRKGQLLNQIGRSITPSGPGTLTFKSTDPSGIVLGEGNQLRIIIKSLSRDKTSGTNDQVEIDQVEVRILH